MGFRRYTHATGLSAIALLGAFRQRSENIPRENGGAHDNNATKSHKLITLY